MKRAVLLLLLLAGCDDMTKQPKQNTYATQPTAPVPARTVEFRAKLPPPPPVTAALLARGQQRFRIDCVPCHGENGDGNGMVVQRGFPAPPSYHIERLVNAPTQHFYDVMTNGYGAMYSFYDRVSPSDRWAIAAYIRALQVADRVPAAELAPEQRAALP